MKRSPIISFALAAIVALMTSCGKDDPSPSAGLENLPEDTGGVHEPHKLNSDASPYGYYLYTPSGYKSDGPKYPLLIFLHGSGEIGNSSADVKVLDKILVNGPPKLIKAKTWKPRYPMVVASLQCHEGYWDATKVKQATEFMMKTYAIDTTRIYMTGLSLGGYGVWDQLTIHSLKSHITAAVPIAGAVGVNTDRAKKASRIPIWSFHGDADATVLITSDIDMYKAIKALSPAPTYPSKLTVYPGVGHDSWSMTYNGTGKGKGSKDYDQFDMDIYDWMFQYQKK